VTCLGREKSSGAQDHVPVPANRSSFSQFITGFADLPPCSSAGGEPRHGESHRPKRTQRWVRPGRTQPGLRWRGRVTATPGDTPRATAPKPRAQHRPTLLRARPGAEYRLQKPLPAEPAGRGRASRCSGCVLLPRDE